MNGVNSVPGPVTQCSTRIKSVEEFLSTVDNAFKNICPVTEKCELWYRGQPLWTILKCEENQGRGDHFEGGFQ